MEVHAVCLLGGGRMTRSADWHDAALEVVYLWEQFTHAREPLAQAERLVSLSNAVHDLKTWLPGFDPETGTMPWDREGD